VSVPLPPTAHDTNTCEQPAPAVCVQVREVPEAVVPDALGPTASKRTGTGQPARLS
jgi:hypothetical protein